MTISETLAAWITGIRCGEIPEEIVALAKRNILDVTGTTLAASREPVAGILKRYLKSIGGAKQSTIVGLGQKSSMIEAAMANGVLGHYLDYDDLYIPVAGGGGPHISVAVFPAALAVAEHVGATGRDLIASYVVGCEIACRVGKAVDPSHYNAGWHTTGTEGIFGSAAAAGMLLGCTQEEMVHALGIAATEASGLRENFGTLTKPLHAGQAAAKGVKAVLLAKQGFTSARSIFEGKNGYCKVFSKEPKETEITKNLGTFIGFPEMRLKLYPCCAASHSAIYAMLELIRESGIKREEIAAIEVKGDAQMKVPLIYDKPTDAIEAKFSVQFPLALAVTRGQVTMSEFTDENVRNPEFSSLMSKIKLIPMESLRSKDPHSRCAIVEVTTANGGRLSQRCDYPPGTPQNPISTEDILEKFEACAGSTLGKQGLENAVKLLVNLQHVDDLKDLMKILGAFTKTQDEKNKVRKAGRK